MAKLDELRVLLKQLQSVLATCEVVLDPSDIASAEMDITSVIRTVQRAAGRLALGDK